MRIEKRIGTIYSHLAIMVLITLASSLSGCGGDSTNDKLSAFVQTKDAILKAVSVTATPNWVRCAVEDGQCSFPGTATVRFGLNQKFFTKVATNTIRCSVAVFGDPYFGVDKICDYDAGTAPPVTTAWTACAVEDGTCVFPGTMQVRFGVGGAYYYQTATGSIACTTAVFGDPAFGLDKSCDYGSSVKTEPTWTRCALESQQCAFSGTKQVRFGINGAFYSRTATSSILCSADIFGDPAYNADKFCDYTDPDGTISAWGPVIPFPIVPVAAANLSNGNVLTWSAYSPITFGGDNGKTYTSIFNPATQSTSVRVVTETGHDMFCPGTSLLGDGRVLVSGGSSSSKTSIYDPASDSWSAASAMNIARGYQGNVTLSSGSVLTLGGSWSGGTGGKSGEIWTPGGAWTKLPGIPIAPFIGPDPAGDYRGDNHLWLFSQPNGKVFHAGPSANMNWIDTAGNGNVIPAGTRGDDAYSMNGNAVMYDIGKVLKTGGALAYEDVLSNASAYVIDISSGTARTRKIASMHYARALHNSVVLPNGQVVITGGQAYVKIFSDDQSVLMAELWDPQSETFKVLSAMAVPRNYHSFSLLLPDGRVLVGGGGLCGNCSVEHLDAQILTPPYLTNVDGSAATRPVILASPSKTSYGAPIVVSTGDTVTAFSLMRLSSVTHSLNNDQRRIPVQFTAMSSTSYTLKTPAAGIAPPGYYMLFALNAQGVPSESKSILIQ